jgi:hypothetical protein
MSPDRYWYGRPIRSDSTTTTTGSVARRPKVVAVDPDARLSEIESKLESNEYESEGEAMADLALAVEAINNEATEAGFNPDRLRGWIQRLYAAVRKIVDRFHARGFSITVGVPLGVSVSVDWE